MAGAADSQIVRNRAAQMYNMVTHMGQVSHSAIDLA